MAQIITGDCLEVLKGMPDKSVDAGITDPPYGTKVTAWDHSIDPMIFSQCIRVSRGYCAFFYSNTRLWHILGTLHGLGVDTWVMPWFKPNAMGFERRFAPQWVPIVVTYRGNLPFWGKDLITCPIVPHKNVPHPTIKPVAVVKWLIEQATKEGDLVLDPFLGSGTTALAAIQAGRDYIGIEINPEYVAIAERRISELSLDTAA